jgi:hypothetical protein
VDASDHRAALATRAGVFWQALDAQVTAQAENFLEKMLCHQLVVLHTLGMEEVIRLQEHPTCPSPLEHARRINTVSRTFEAFQNGCAVRVTQTPRHAAAAGGPCCLESAHARNSTPPRTYEESDFS